jgi:hypothetical protein
MKELEMNWTKLNPELRNKVMDILVDGILNRDTAFKTDLMSRLNIQQQQQQQQQIPTQVVNQGRSTFGSSSNNSSIFSNKNFIIGTAVIVLVYFLIRKKRVTNYGRLS